MKDKGAVLINILLHRSFALFVDRAKYANCYQNKRDSYRGLTYEFADRCSFIIPGCCGIMPDYDLEVQEHSMLSKLSRI